MTENVAALRETDFHLFFLISKERRDSMKVTTVSRPPMLIRVRKLLKQIYRCKALYLMILPPIITLFIFHYVPLYGVQIAFKNFRSSLGIWESESGEVGL